MSNFHSNIPDSNRDVDKLKIAHSAYKRIGYACF